ncbi:MAG TPA: hypothetical protein VMF32_26320 [Xanthobacteraceae bacterium]|nr:hypothetical protein [Xanthobacteraceae bacterium]
MRRRCIFAAILIAKAGFTSAVIASPAERTEIVDGAPALVKYIPGDTNKPLVVFIPGAGHLARIAYGGPGARDTDFLAYWLHRQGYGFLAISYPLGTTPTMSPGVPAFSITDWGRQAAEITHDTVATNHLEGHVILLGWSMGGRILEPYAEASLAGELKLDLFVSLASTPGFDHHAAPPNVEVSAAGYARIPGATGAMERELSYQDRLNGHVIIDTESYERDYIGDTPVGLTGWGLKYTPKGFVEDQWPDINVALLYDFARLPLTAALYGDSPLDPIHALADRANWGFILTNVLSAKMRATVSPGKFTDEQWKAVSELIAKAPSQLSAHVHGDHFFFVGEKGARETASLIATMELKTQNLLKDLSSTMSRREP